MSDLQIRNLTKKYGRLTALDRVDIDIPSGRYGLLGPNGAGKTTLLRILATILQPDAGDIRKGSLSWKKPNAVRGRIGYLPQHFGMYKYLTVCETLNHFAALKGIGAGRLKDEVGRALRLTHMEENSGKKVGALSGGMLRRLGIGQALLGSPEILLIDEPTAGLDPEERIRFRNLLQSVPGDQTVLISTHIVDDVETSCTHVAVINNGKVVGMDTVTGFIGQARGHVYERLLSPWDSLTLPPRAMQVSRNVTTDGFHRIRYICLESTGDAPAEPSLEDAYMMLIHGGELA